MSLHVLAYNLKRVIADPRNRAADPGDAGLTGTAVFLPSPSLRTPGHPLQTRVITQPRPIAEVLSAPVLSIFEPGSAFSAPYP